MIEYDIKLYKQYKAQIVHDLLEHILLDHVEEKEKSELYLNKSELYLNIINNILNDIKSQEKSIEISKAYYDENNNHNNAYTRPYRNMFDFTKNQLGSLQLIMQFQDTKSNDEILTELLKNIVLETIIDYIIPKIIYKEGYNEYKKEYSDKIYNILTKYQNLVGMPDYNYIKNSFKSNIELKNISNQITERLKDNYQFFEIKTLISFENLRLEHIKEKLKLDDNNIAQVYNDILILQKLNESIPVQVEQILNQKIEELNKKLTLSQTQKDYIILLIKNNMEVFSLKNHELGDLHHKLSNKYENESEYPKWLKEANQEIKNIARAGLKVNIELLKRFLTEYVITDKTIIKEHNAVPQQSIELMNDYKAVICYLLYKKKELNPGLEIDITEDYVSAIREQLSNIYQNDIYLIHQLPEIKEFLNEIKNFDLEVLKNLCCGYNSRIYNLLFPPINQRERVQSINQRERVQLPSINWNYNFQFTDIIRNQQKEEIKTVLKETVFFTEQNYIDNMDSILNDNVVNKFILYYSNSLNTHQPNLREGLQEFNYLNDYAYINNEVINKKRKIFNASLLSALQEEMRYGKSDYKNDQSTKMVKYFKNHIKPSNDYKDEYYEQVKYRTFNKQAISEFKNKIKDVYSSEKVKYGLINSIPIIGGIYTAYKFINSFKKPCNLVHKIIIYSSSIMLSIPFVVPIIVVALASIVSFVSALAYPVLFIAGLINPRLNTPRDTAEKIFTVSSLIANIALLSCFVPGPFTGFIFGFLQSGEIVKSKNYCKTKQELQECVKDIKTAEIERNPQGIIDENTIVKEIIEKYNVKIAENKPESRSEQRKLWKEIIRDCRTSHGITT